MSRREPGIWSRGLGAELRDLRDAAGLSTRLAGERVGLSASTLSRIENGKRKVTSEEVSALLVVFGVTGERRESLIELARQPEQPTWVGAGSRTGLPKSLATLISFETTATRVTNVSMLVLPGLLQTPEYTRALMRATGVSDFEAESRVATRLGRQALLSRPSPPDYVAYLDEGALRRRLGSSKVMVDQLERILKESQRPNVTIRALPSTADEVPGLDGSFLLLEFAKARPVVQLDYRRSCLFIDDAKDVETFHEAVDTLDRVALTPEDSATFIARIMADYERE
ncbi:hypothetical protein Lfu02_19950 [Longispora fulva]|uniref:Transcriptional regulator with XRE-family HTH domain n=1 Tax=Longispora fulva TaxID=619741 RepID=A0A8J7GG28_9ACTN|nr:helix-turn-helix transcriptional regulator [Longispora fulva]MBG6139998.1 transcriptional regulator with XRE-family HTH domain [Longispora fulva]GIG57623.1 hypothetical protein Lfu02_19950 [Longispora fulva]